MTEKLNALLHEAERLEAVQACRNLMGKYSYYHTAFRNTEYVELWAKRDDDLLVMPFGIFDGWEGVKRCYVDMHGDRYDPEDAKLLKGLMMVHAMDTEVIEVAADGLTAKASFISPGHETAPTPGKEKGCWCWGKYAVDFIKEDGVWKFWHLTLYPVFLTPFDRSWGLPTLEELDGPKETPNMPCDRSLEEPFWEYGKDAVYPENEPRLPLPYDSF